MFYYKGLESSTIEDFRYHVIARHKLFRRALILHFEAIFPMFAYWQDCFGEHLKPSRYSMSRNDMRFVCPLCLVTIFMLY